MGPRGVLLPSPDGSVPRADLHPALRGAHFVEHPSADGALAERSGHEHGGLSGRARHAGRDPPDRVRQLVPGISGFHAHLPQQHFVLHGNRAVSLRHAALLRGGRVPEGPHAAAIGDLLQQSVERRLVAPGRCRPLYAGRVHVGAGHGGEVSRDAAVQPVSGGARQHPTLLAGAALRLRDPAGTARSADGGGVGRKAVDQRDRGAPGNGAVPGEQPRLQERVGDFDGSAVLAAGEGIDGAAALPRPARRPQRCAGPALRRCGVDAPAADGRGSGCGRHSDHRGAAAGLAAD